MALPDREPTSQDDYHFAYPKGEITIFKRIPPLTPDALRTGQPDLSHLESELAEDGRPFSIEERITTEDRLVWTREEGGMVTTLSDGLDSQTKNALSTTSPNEPKL